MPEPTGPTDPAESSSDRPRRISGGRISGAGGEPAPEPADDRPRRLSGGPDGLEDLTPPRPEPPEEDQPGDGKPVTSVEAQGFVQDPLKAHSMAKAEYPYRILESGLREKGEDQHADSEARWAVNAAEKAGEQYEKEKSEIQEDFKTMLDILTVACSNLEGLASQKRGDRGVNLLGPVKSSIQETEVADTRQIAFDQFLDVVFSPEDKQIFITNLDRLHKKGGMGFPKFLRGTFEVPTKLGYSIKIARFAPDYDEPTPTGYGLPKPTYAIALVNREKK